MFWYPQALFTAEQTCRRICCSTTYFFKLVRFRQNLLYMLQYLMFMHFSKTSNRVFNRRGTQRHSKWRQICVLSSHIDPIGDQNAVQYPRIFVNILRIIGISGCAVSWKCCLVSLLQTSIPYHRFKQSVSRSLPSHRPA